MAKRVVAIWFFALCCGAFSLGCEATKDKAAPPEPVKAEPADAIAADVDTSDDELCAWMCANCFREYAGLLEYPGDCRGVCMAQLATKPCSDMLRAKVTCQFLEKACDTCDAEKQAALECLQACDKMRRVQGEESVPPHCRDRTP
jgi:hypothetical protein